jgi:hypothetical protein
MRFTGRTHLSSKADDYLSSLFLDHRLRFSAKPSPEWKVPIIGEALQVHEAN